jgi:prophage antirepressor-like protein
MKDMMVFNSPEFGDIGILEENGKLYFPAIECARLLKYANPYDAVRRHTKGIVKHDILTNGGKQEVSFVSEPNLYRLIAHSKLPAAARFEAWIYEDIVPLIRRHGFYMTEKVALEALETPEEFLARALIVAQEMLRKRDERLALLEAENAKLAADNKGLEIRLDQSGEYYSVKRVAEINGVSGAALDWRKLKAESENTHHGIEKAFASSYGNVNSYHVDVWKSVYPNLIYGGDSTAVGSDSEAKPAPELKGPASPAKGRRLEVYQIEANSTRSGKPLIFSLDSGSDPHEIVKRLKELNPHLDFEIVIQEA